MCMCKRRKDSSGGSALRLHAAAHNGNQCKIRLNFDGIRVCETMNVRNHLLLLVHELTLVHNNRHRVDSGGHMLDADSVILKGLQNLAAEADLRVHHILGDQYGTEILLSGNSRDGIAGFLAGALHNPCAVILRLVRILDVDRNALVTHRDDGILVQNARTHIGKLAKLLIGNGADRRRRIHNSRICHKESGHIRPVFIDADVTGPRNNGACDVRASAGEGFHLSVKATAIEARNHRIFQTRELFCGLFLRFALIKLTILVKKDDLRRIHKGEAKILRHHASVQILSAGCRVVAIRLLLEVLLDGAEFILEGILQTKALNDLIVAGLNLAEGICEILPLCRKIIAAIQEIRDLRIAGEALSGCGRNDIDSARIRMDNGTHLLKLLRIRKGASAEFDNLFHTLPH